MLLSIKLQPNMQCEYICSQIQSALSKYQQNNDMADTLLVIDIKKPISDDTMIPKLEHKILTS
jgi:hypothetical protein